MGRSDAGEKKRIRAREPACAKDSATVNCSNSMPSVIGRANGERAIRRRTSWWVDVGSCSVTWYPKPSNRVACSKQCGAAPTSDSCIANHFLSDLRFQRIGLVPLSLVGNYFCSQEMSLRLATEIILSRLQLGSAGAHVLVLTNVGEDQDDRGERCLARRTETMVVHGSQFFGGGQ